MLLERFKGLWEEISSQRNAQPEAQAFELAAAALMLEVARADFAQTEDEQATLLALLRETFALSADDVSALAEKAKAAADDAVCLHDFVRTINDTAAHDEKVRLLESLWKVAYADGDLSKYEEHLIRRIADLLYLPHDVFIRTKLTAV